MSGFDQELQQYQTGQKEGSAEREQGRDHDITRSPTNRIPLYEQAHANGEGTSAKFYRVIERGVVREDVSLLSEFVGYVEPGMTVESLATRTNSRGQVRVLIREPKPRSGT
eukprot:SAG11_NODE_16796_length_537_cov_1.296804_1_plen_110_part_10